MTPEEYLGLQYNIPTVQALRVLELSAAIALILSPQQATKYFKDLGLDLKDIYKKQSTAGLRTILG